MLISITIFCNYYSEIQLKTRLDDKLRRDPLAAITETVTDK